MIAIPNMEMPKDCWECPMFTWDEVGEFNCFLGAKVKDIDPFEERLGDCPLIEIPTDQC